MNCNIQVKIILFHFFEQKRGPLLKTTKKIFFAKMTIDTPIESSTRVYSKYVVTKNNYRCFWPKNPKKFTKIRHFWSFSSIMFMVAIYAGDSLNSILTFENKMKHKVFQISY